MQNIKEAIDLKTLVGTHTLSGCDCATEQVVDWGERYISAGVLRFVLDGVTYEAIENPDDGYRSSLEGLHLAPDGKVVENTFSPLTVNAIYHDFQMLGDSRRECDILEFQDLHGKTIIEIGTIDIDDYYPGCIMVFNQPCIES